MRCAPEPEWRRRSRRWCGVISVNGAAAHKADPGDRIIICAYVGLTEEEADAHKPVMVYLDEENNVTNTRNFIPVQKPVLVSG